MLSTLRLSTASSPLHPLHCILLSTSRSCFDNCGLKPYCTLELSCFLDYYFFGGLEWKRTGKFVVIVFENDLFLACCHRYFSREEKLRIRDCEERKDRVGTR